MAPVVVTLAAFTDIVARIVQEMEGLCALEQIVAAGDGVDLGPSFDGSPAAPVVNRVRWALVRELALGVTRLLDPPHGDRATLPRAFRDLRDQGLRAELAAAARVGAAGHDESVHDAGRLLDDVVRAWQDFVAGPHEGGGGAMREARQAFQAQDMPATVVRLPPFDAIHGALRAIRPITVQLGLLTGVAREGFDDAIATWRARAACFWEMQRRIVAAPIPPAAR
jgi:hypothetical protein